MVRIKEFAGYRHKEVEEFSLKPYDVITEAEAKEWRKNPKSGIHITLPLGEGDQKYENAARELERQSRNFIKDEPSIYVYGESSPEFTQRGFIFCVHLQDYLEGRIKKHEKTREAPLNDRTKHIEATKANLGLVWTIFRRNERAKDMMSKIQNGKPMIEFQKYGWTHRVWKESNPEMIGKIKEIFSDIELYIADGHHRCAAAAEYYKKLKSEKDGEHAYVEVFCASDDEVRIMPYNRIIRKLPFSFEEFLRRVEENFLVNPTEKQRPDRHEILMYGNKRWWSLMPRKIPGGILESLDVSILQNQLLEPVLNITDPRKDPNIFFEGGNLNKNDLEKLGKDNDLVFFMHPTSVDEVEKVADLGMDMPPKSTWFDPKLLSCLIVHKLVE